MTAEELDLAIEELELRLERLRALYEQYFLGFEKVEPAVARKDVERRIYVLRREKIRNTGKRFKLQTLIQRYNTFQQYWQRVCREIENGTYRRLLQRAERKMGPDELLTIAAQRRFGRRRLADGPSESARPDAAHSESDAPDAPTLRPARPDTVSSAPATAVGAAETVSFASSAFTPEEPSTGTLGRRLAPPPKPARRPNAEAAPQPATPSPMPPRPGAVSSPLPPRPVPAPPRASAVSSPLPPRPADTPAAAPSPPVGPRHETAAPRPDTPPAPRSKTQRPSSFDSLKLDMDFLGDWDPGSLRTKAQPPRPVGSPALKPPAAPPAAPSGGAQPIAAEKAGAPAGKPGSKPKSIEQTAQAPKPPAPKASASSAEGFDARVRELHEKLNELKRQNREGSQVSLEGLAKSLRDTEAKLRAKHGSRRIDFEVVVKDGRAVVKPIVR